MENKLFIDTQATAKSKEATDIIEHLPDEIKSQLPNPEPPFPNGGWLYRALEPYYTKQSIDDVCEAMKNGEISSGTKWPRKMADAICAQYGVPVALPTSSGAGALHVALLCADIYQKEVIVPTFTMVAVANSVKLAGGIPVYADSSVDNINPGLKEIQSCYRADKTRAVIVCHTYGVVCPEIEEIATWCREKDLVLIEDICECMGARVKERDQATGGALYSCHSPQNKYVLAGCYGDFSCASLYANKQITAGDGGWVHARDIAHGPRLKSLINHGFNPSYHFLHFETAPNAKINGLGAAFICSQLQNDNLNIQITKRGQVARWYREYFGKKDCVKTGKIKLINSDTIKGEKGCYHDAPWVFGVECCDRKVRDELRVYLAKPDIAVETRCYFFPLHLQPVNYLEIARDNPQSPVGGDSSVAKQAGRRNPGSPTSPVGGGTNSTFNMIAANTTETWKCGCPNAAKFAATGFYLPTHSFLEEQDCAWIVDCVEGYFGGEDEKVGKPLREKGWADKARLKLLE